MWVSTTDVAARVPFTLGFLGVMIAANWAAGTLSGRLPLRALRNWGISHRRVVRGEAFRLLTGTFLSHDRAMFCRQLVFAAAVIGYYEWQTGTLRATLMFAGINVVGSLIVLFAILPLIATLWPDSGLAPLRSLDVGMSAGGFGLVGTIVWQWPDPWLWLTALLAAIAVKAWLKFELIADTAHVVCLILGVMAEAMLAAVWTAA